MAMPEALKFTVSLVDKITAPVAKVSDSLRDMRDRYSQNAEVMAGGAAGVVASGAAMYASLAPAIELDRQLHGLKGFGVQQDAIDKMRNSAIEFSNDYAISAASVAEHAVQMRRVLGEMPQDVMIQTAKASALLTAKMGSDSETVARFIKNMSGNFQGDLGAGEFVDQLTAMTLQSQKLYGINLDEMEGMMSGMHSLTSGLGVSLQEQMSTMGMLSQYMDNGDVTTYYTNFLEGIHEAQEKLNINLMDDNGKLLEMPQIIDKLQGKFKGMKPFELRHVLDDAGLGDGSLMLMKLVENADEFKKKHAELSKVKGLDSTLEAAKSNVFIWDKLATQIANISTAFGAVLLPALAPIVEKMSDMAGWVTDFTTRFPNLAKLIGTIAISIMAVGIAGGVIAIVSGIFGNFMAVITLFAPVVTALGAAFTWLKGAVIAVNLAMALNPMGAIVVGIMAAIAAVTALVIWWDDLKAAFADIEWVQVIMNAIESVVGTIGSVFSGIGSFFGFGGDDEQEIKSVQQTRPKASLQQGGIVQQMAQSSSRVTHVGGVTINSQTMPAPTDVRNSWEMLAG